MARHRSHSIEFKRQVAQEFVAGETLYALAKRHDLSRQLIRVWVQKYEAGGLDEDAQAAELLQEYETKIAALERMVGRQALEIEFLKGALRNAPRPRSATTSVIAGPTGSRGSVLLIKRRLAALAPFVLDYLPGSGRRRHGCGFDGCANRRGVRPP